MTYNTNNFKINNYMKTKKCTIQLRNCNLSLLGKGRDINGNAVVKVSYPNSRAFSIQISNGSLPNTYSLLRGLELSELKDNDIKVISTEITNYISNYGSLAQKSNLKKILNIII